MPAGDSEIQSVGRYLPEATVLGVLRDGKGLLLGMPSSSASADTMQRCESALLKAGVTQWSWSMQEGELQIRVYWTSGRTWWLVAAVLAILAFLLYDVHAQQDAAGWLAALQRRHNISF